MPSVILEKVDLLYPVKAHHRPSVKDYIVNALLRRPCARPRSIKALEQVTFRVEAGECVGLIGRNGAGKSTLLRTVAGVYPIAAGVRDVSGRIASLFDIAAGFEWNATGWENIRLRAYLQGETPSSLRDKLPAIVEFADLGTMLDMPLKCYSTGRTMLLSFAIAVGCDPDVLVIDEFLSTGDLLVREKAVARMIEMLRSDRIVMVASHDLAFLRQFCSRVIWLDKGRVVDDGPAECVIERYVHAMKAAKAVPTSLAA